MPQIKAPDFALDTSLASGQTFRWKQLDDWYYGVVGSLVLRVKQDGEYLIYESPDPNVTDDWITHYFALDVDLPEVLRQIDVDAQIHDAIIRLHGLRILRQDSWEVLASFICATFSNIKRIEGMIEALCQAYGDPVGLNGFRTFGFPSAKRLASVPERRLRSLGLGYRAPYLRATARLVVDGRIGFNHLHWVDYETAKRVLMRYDGVGGKVADCVALFGFEKYEAFPLDVWMLRVMRYYFRHKKMTPKVVLNYARQHFGPYAGYAQQYLFHAARNPRKRPQVPVKTTQRLHAAKGAKLIGAS